MEQTTESRIAQVFSSAYVPYRSTSFVFVAKCQQYHYSSNPLFYKKTMGFSTFIDADVADLLFIYIFYETNDIIHNEEVPLMTIWGFIGACGGNLGLFLGFSFSTFFDFLISFMSKKKGNKKKEKNSNKSVSSL